MKDLLWQYFPSRTRASKHSGFVSILHACFASSAWLKSWMSRSPSPPPAFGLKLAGSSKHDIVYVGMAVRTALSMVNLPAFESRRVDQLCARCLILSTSDVKRSFFLLPKCSGNPRYFPDPPSFSIPSVSLTCFLTSAGVFIEKVIEVFSLLIFCPEALSYSHKIFFSIVQHSGDVWQKNMVSSAKSRWFRESGAARIVVGVGISAWAHALEVLRIQRGLAFVR